MRNINKITVLITSILAATIAIFIKKKKKKEDLYKFVYLK